MTNFREISEALGRVRRKITIAAGMTLALVGSATAQSIEVGGFTVDIIRGPETELCELVLQTIEAVGDDVIGQCVPNENRGSDLPKSLRPHPYLNWALIREQLPAEFQVPNWERRDLNDPEWYAEAAFLRALLLLRQEDFWVARHYSNDEIRQMVDQFLRDGTLPYDDGRDHTIQILPPEGLVLYQSEFEFRGHRQVITRLKYETFNGIPYNYLCEPVNEYPAQSPVFFIEPTAPEVGYFTSKDSMSFADQSHSGILTFHGDLYHVRIQNRFLSFSRNLPFPEKDPATGWGHIETCAIEILRNES